MVLLYCTTEQSSQQESLQGAVVQLGRREADLMSACRRWFSSRWCRGMRSRLCCSHFVCQKNKAHSNNRTMDDGQCTVYSVPCSV